VGDRSYERFNRVYLSIVFGHKTWLNNAELPPMVAFSSCVCVLKFKRAK
jgi:hypothetical protein